MTIKECKGSFSQVSGSSVRIVYTDSGKILGTVKKLEGNKGYKITRTIDGKVRTKPTLAEAYKSIRRAS